MTMAEHHKPLAFISLSLGFLIIWTAVLAGILVSRTVKDQGIADETIDVFHIHEHVGKISFSLGHEMVSTVDWLLSDNPEPKKDTLKVTWKMTDNVIENVRNHGVANHWVKISENNAGLLDTIQAKLQRIRKSITVNSNPVDVVHVFSDLNKLLLKKSFKHQELMEHLQTLPLPSASYTLFVKGMFQRFGEVALGTIFVKTDIPLNKTEFLEMRTNSQTLMDMAFSFVPHAHGRWKELREQDPQIALVTNAVAEKILTHDSTHRSLDLERKGFSTGLTMAYLDGVKEQISTLLLTKEVLNTAVSAWVDKTYHKARNSLAFHLSVSIVALLAVLVCLIVTGCTFTYIGKLQNEGKLTSYGNDNYYSTSDKAQILLDSPTYLKPQCYL